MPMMCLAVMILIGDREIEKNDLDLFNLMKLFDFAKVLII